MFQLCIAPDDFSIYYDYYNKKLYGCYNQMIKAKPNYNILLIQPFILLVVNLFNNWIENYDNWGRRLICILAILAVTIGTHLFYKTAVESTREKRSRFVKELPEPSPEDWECYLKLAKEWLKVQIRLYILLTLGIITSIGLFLWNGFILFLLLYLLFYSILHPFILFGKPIKKYKFIKSKTTPNP